ncbi:MAG: transcriptional regulator [Sulfurospirillum sp.]|nr:transcriptional regulator [Sulfurospirillum sp.]
MRFVVLAAIVPDNKEEEAIGIAKKAGAGGVTILHGKNIGLEEKKVFFGLTLEENVSVLLFILPQRLSMKILKAFRKELQLNNENNTNGIVFTFPLTHLSGMESKEVKLFEQEILEEL